MISDPHKRRLGVQPTAQMGRSNQCICRVLCITANSEELAPYHWISPCKAWRTASSNSASSLKWAPHSCRLPRHAPACSGVSGTPSGVSGTAFAFAFGGFALDVAGGAVLLLLGFHIADEIVRRASLLAHGESS